MLEKQGIPSRLGFVDPSLPDDGDLNRESEVFIAPDQAELARELFYRERADER